MADESVKFAASRGVVGKARTDNKIFGVSIATVLNNIDCTGEARVQLQIPSLPGYTPWARLASPMAGTGRGMFFVPQIGEEVLVAFSHGDVREPYVLGACWNTQDKPPSAAPTDAVTQRKIRTPLGHELSFDEAKQSVTLSSNSMAKVTLDLEKAQISTPFAEVTVSIAGDVTIKAKTKLTLDAPVIEIKAKTLLTAESSANAVFKASATCTVQGALVKIN
jgi:uncharacterized protein involved in type VI secretion and phage assembly